MFGRKKKAESGEAVSWQRNKSIGSNGSNKRKVVDKNPRSIIPLNRDASIKGIMKFSTHRESLDTNYSESENGETSSSSKGIQFHQIEIREYERTLGDNPSCSSGPPMS